MAFFVSWLFFAKTWNQQLLYYRDGALVNAQKITSATNLNVEDSLYLETIIPNNNTHSNQKRSRQSRRDLFVFWGTCSYSK